MRKITEIIVHCSATAAGKDFGAADIDRWHKGRGFAGIGYHYVVRLDGRVEPGRPESRVGAHCLGHNAGSIGVCYIGGLKSDGRTPADTRTPAQREALKKLIADLKRRYPGAKVHGHREFAAKACPCFDAAKEYATGLVGAIVLLSLLLASCGRSVVKEQHRVEQTVTVEQTVERERVDSVLREMEAGADSVRIGVEYEGEQRRRLSVSVYGARRKERVERESREREKTDEEVHEELHAEQHSERTGRPPGGATGWPVVAFAAGIAGGMWLRSRFRTR